MKSLGLQYVLFLVFVAALIVGAVVSEEHRGILIGLSIGFGVIAVSTAYPAYRLLFQGNPDRHDDASGV